MASDPGRCLFVVFPENKYISSDDIYTVVG